MPIKPILFNTEMVRAILDGRKSCTRRIVKTQQLVGLLPDKCKNGVPEEFLKEKKFMFKPYCDMTDIELINTAYKAPYQPDDILYVRETWSEWTDGYLYKAWNSPFPQAGQSSVMRWHPSIHMPKEAARIFLRVTNVRVERLQDIDGKMCVKEGIEEEPLKYVGDEFVKGMFHDLWDSTIKKSDLDRYGWNANPWVWVIEFERCEKPEGE